MDTIHFDIQKSNIEDYLTTAIFVNNIDLKDILFQVEQSQIKDPSLINIAGAYEGISPYIAFHLKNHFLKDTIREYQYYGDRFTLMEYANTGIPGDHTITCQIDICKDVVEWSNFKNFDSLTAIEFDYSDIGSFRFERKQYEAAISTLCNNQIKELYV
ncbi:hypothetical protein ACFSTE_18800 [Aquimarina hainanensis]|uniref:Uncharacterized protein n=1 Tax=Aquimarina hainanensis TaxID=1578017 RepID=A0ABW5ND15_9FLAO|nr:hypothetical protein [Aquimarina sp. TRL1]QKX06624.1 hypothetical protein HN014_17450 [Aquimarina sp. TRL1]